MMFKTTLLSLYFLTAIQAAAIPGFQEVTDGVLKLDYRLKRQVNGFSLDKRSDAEISYTKQGDYYFADLYFGTDFQKISVAIDTGSSDLWVIGKDSGIATDHGVYDQSSSTSLSKSFKITYYDKSTANGEFVQDQVSLAENGPTVPGFQFAVADEASGQKNGILGLGLKSLEQTDEKYDNFPLALKNTRVIKKAAYSFYSTNEEEDSGTILFGGVDNAKFEGDLHELPITDSKRLNIDVKTMKFGDNTVEIGQSATLDTGSSWSHFQPDIADKIAEAAGCLKASGFYYYKKCTDAVDFTVSFDGVDITVPIKYMTTPLTGSNGQTLKACALTILPSSNPNTLGANFMRSIYTLFDIEDKTISIAPIKFTSDEQITNLS